MNERVEKVKTHIKENKKVYITGTVCFVVGVAGTMVFKNRPQVTQIINTVAPVIAPVFKNDNSSSVNFGGYTRKFVQNDRTKEIWETVKDSAKDAGVTASAMSRHLNKHTDDICGDTYSIIGIGTTG